MATIDLSVTVDDATMSAAAPRTCAWRSHRTGAGPGFWQVSSVHQSLHTGAHIDSPLHVFQDGITTAEICLDQVMGEALVVDLSFAGAEPRRHDRRPEARRRRRRAAGRHRAPPHGLDRQDVRDAGPTLHAVAVLPPGVGAMAGRPRARRTSASTSSRSIARGCPTSRSEDFPMHRVILGAGVVIMEGPDEPRRRCRADAWTSRRPSTRSRAPRARPPASSRLCDRRGPRRPPPSLPHEAIAPAGPALGALLPGTRP